MVNIKKEIITKVEYIHVLCQRTRRNAAWCETCGANREFVTPPEAAALVQQPLNQIAELAATGALHINFTPARTFLVCLSSLVRIDGDSR